MRFHPVVSIIIGVIISFTLYLIAISVFGVIGWVGAFQAIQGASWFGTFLLIISYILAGFLATYFTKEKKLQYALYEGIIILLIFSILTIPNSSLDATKLLLLFIYGILLLLLAVMGGMFGQMINEKFDGFSPLLAVIAGSIIGYSCVVLLTLITGHAPDSYSLGVIEIAVGVISFLIGGFLSTFLAKEKKIQNGIYTGITILAIILIIGAIQMLTNHWSVYIHMIGYVVYVISAVIGAYLGIKIVGKKSWSFHPIISIILGVIVSFIILDFVCNLIPLGVSDSIFQQISTATSIGSLVIGGFIATYFSKEKKIQYGIYLGIIWFLINLISTLIMGLPTSVSDPIITVLINICYILAPTIGSYLAIKFS